MENNKNWPLGTEIKKLPDGKTEVKLPRPMSGEYIEKVTKKTNSDTMIEKIPNDDEENSGQKNPNINKVKRSSVGESRIYAQWKQKAKEIRRGFDPYEKQKTKKRRGERKSSQK